MTDKPWQDEVNEVRDKFANSLGVVDPDVLAPLLNPAFMGGPMWPNLRQAWRVIRSGKKTIVLSDGLSDPFSDETDPNVGFAIEVLAETEDPMPEEIQGSWLSDLVYQVSQQCAYHGGVRELFDQLGVLSLELPNTDLLEPVATPGNPAGALLGLPMPGIETELSSPGGSIRVLTAKLLWPTEANYAAAKGKAGRESLARHFTADGTHHRSSISRKPVV